MGFFDFCRQIRAGAAFLSSPSSSPARSLKAKSRIWQAANETLESRRYLSGYNYTGDSPMLEGTNVYGFQTWWISGDDDASVSIDGGEPSSVWYGDGYGFSISGFYDDNFSTTVSITDNYDQTDTGTLTVENVQPIADFTYDDNGDGTYTLSLSNPYDPSGADTAAGFLYSFASTYSGLGDSWSSTPSTTIDAPTSSGANLWMSIQDKDGGHTDYNINYIASTINIGTVTDTSVDLTWNDVGVGESSVILQRAPYGGSFSTIATLDADSTYYTDTTVSAGTHYQYRVRAAGTTGTTADTVWSPKQAVWTLTPPAAPSNLAVADASGGQYALTWDDNASDEDGFYVEHSADGVTWTNAATLSPNATSYTTTGLSSGDCNQFKICAFNDGMESDSLSAQASFNAPTDVHAMVLSSTQVDVTWRENSSAADGFEIQYSTSSSFSSGVSSIMAGANTGSKWVSGLSPNTQYYFQVRARTAAGTTTSFAGTPSAKTPATGTLRTVSGFTKAAIVSAINSSNGGDTIYFPHGTYNVSGQISNGDLTGGRTLGQGRIYVGETALTTDGSTGLSFVTGESATLGTPDPAHESVLVSTGPLDSVNVITDPVFKLTDTTVPTSTSSDPWKYNFKFTGLTFVGLGFNIAGGGNTPVAGLVVDGCRFDVEKDVPNGQSNANNNCGIRFTEGLVESIISDNLFSPISSFGAGIYGEGGTKTWDHLIIANNEFRNGNEGIHLIGNTSASDLLIEQNYFSGLHRIGIELQHGGDNTIVQDNYSENPTLDLSNDNNNQSTFAYSIINDVATNPIVRRNFAKANVVTTQSFLGARYNYELGGFGMQAYDNYSYGGHQAVISNGTNATGLVSHNRILKLNKGFEHTNGSTMQYDTATNGPGRIGSGGDGDYHEDGPDVQLTWDLARPKPGPYRRVFGLSLDTTNHLLTIAGTKLADAVSVTKSGSLLVVTVNSESFIYPASSINAVQFASSKVLSSLDIGGGTQVNVAEHGSGIMATVLKISSLTIAGGGTPGVFDLKNNALILDYSTTSPLATLKGYLTSGQLLSSLVSSTFGASTTVALDENSNFGKTTFEGMSVDSTSVLVKFTYDGDATFDGQVDIADLYYVGANYDSGHTGTNNKTWASADFNGDGWDDVHDLTVVADNWQAGATTGRLS